MHWADSVTVAYAAQTKSGVHFGLVDVRSGAERQPLALGDSLVQDFAPLPGGWAWIPVDGQRIEVQGPGGRREVAKPDWAGVFSNLSVSTDGRTLAYSAWNAGTYDTLRVDVVPVAGGTAEPWAAKFAESGGALALPDGSVFFPVFTTEESVTLFHLRGPGRIERLGTIPHSARFPVDVSNDLRRVTLNARDYHGDVWLNKVAHQ